jgi:L-asparaginase II
MQMTGKENGITDAELVRVTRAGQTENVHRGRICVVSGEDGSVLAAWGDAEAPAFVRSTAKPMQAMASLLGGTAEHCGWEDRHLAMMAASQRGYPEQMAALEEMLASSGVPEEALVFHAAKPVASQAREAWARAGGQPRKLYHTCAGKHLGMLAWCRLQGWPIGGYSEPDHPAQREISRRVREWAGASEAEVTFGRDGCGLPVAAMPLKRIALAYARLAAPRLSPDPLAAGAAARISAAMNQFPELVEGPGRLASLLLSDPNMVAKSGAQGLFAFGLRKERIGVAIHVSDGSESAWPHIAMELLHRYGGLSEGSAEKLRIRFPADYRNDAGDPAGRWVPVF